MQLYVQIIREGFRKIILESHRLVPVGVAAMCIILSDQRDFAGSQNVIQSRVMCLSS